MCMSETARIIFGHIKDDGCLKSKHMLPKKLPRYLLTFMSGIIPNTYIDYGPQLKYQNKRKVDKKYMLIIYIPGNV